MRFFIIILWLAMFGGNIFAQKPRLIVTTDIGQDPDDAQSMVRLLHYANEFDIEGLIANADNNYEKEPPVLKPYIIHDMINSYSLIQENLKLHDGNYPDAAYLHSIVKEGTFGNGTNVPVDHFVGKGKDTDGSDWIIKMVDRNDLRPIHISIWGGACDLAQAIWKVKYTRDEQEVDAFVKKLRVFFIGKQDSSNQWIIDNFPDIWLILALDRGGDKWESGYRGMFWGGDMSLTTKEWLHQNINDISPLGSHYPDQAYTGGEKKNPYMAMKEGDSPSILYFIENGLNQPEHPEWGGWGGRYILDRDQLYRDANDNYYDEQAGKVINSPRATVFRWRPDFQNDFAARIQWGVRDYEEANHHPIVSVNGNSAKKPLYISTGPDEMITLDASLSGDTDNDRLSFQWIYYKEAGDLAEYFEIKNDKDSSISLRIPENAQKKNIHIICSVADNGQPSLVSYKRIIIEVE